MLALSRKKLSICRSGAFVSAKCITCPTCTTLVLKICYAISRAQSALGRSRPVGGALLGMVDKSDKHLKGCEAALLRQVGSLTEGFLAVLRAIESIR